MNNDNDLIRRGDAEKACSDIAQKYLVKYDETKEPYHEGACDSADACSRGISAIPAVSGYTVSVLEQIIKEYNESKEAAFWNEEHPIFQMAEEIDALRAAVKTKAAVSGKPFGLVSDNNEFMLLNVYLARLKDNPQYSFVRKWSAAKVVYTTPQDQSAKIAELEAQLKK